MKFRIGTVGTLGLFVVSNFLQLVFLKMDQSQLPIFVIFKLRLAENCSMMSLMGYELWYRKQMLNQLTQQQGTFYVRAFFVRIFCIAPEKKQLPSFQEPKN